MVANSFSGCLSLSGLGEHHTLVMNGSEHGALSASSPCSKCVLALQMWSGARTAGFPRAHVREMFPLGGQVWCLLSSLLPSSHSFLPSLSLSLSQSFPSLSLFPSPYRYVLSFTPHLYLSLTFSHYYTLSYILPLSPCLPYILPLSHCLSLPSLSCNPYPVNPAPLESCWPCSATPGTRTQWSRLELARSSSRPSSSSRGTSTRA